MKVTDLKRSGKRYLTVEQLLMKLCLVWHKATTMRGGPVTNENSNSVVLDQPDELAERNSTLSRLSLGRVSAKQSLNHDYSAFNPHRVSKPTH